MIETKDNDDGFMIGKRVHECILLGRPGFTIIGG